MTKDSDLDDYLDDLLDASVTEQNKATDKVPAAQTDKQPELSTDYNIHTFPSNHASSDKEPVAEKPPENTERRKVERMERLLDDFKRRKDRDNQNTSLATDVANTSANEAATAIEQPEYAQNYSEPVYKNGILQPRWAEQEFEVVISEVAGLRLAVPVFSLGAIHDLAESKLDTGDKPGNSALFVGTAELNHIHYPLIDTCRWLMPEQYADISAGDLNYQYYLSHTKSHYALAVNAVHTSLMLNNESVRWRKAQSKRPWLAGMLKDQRAILVELDILIKHITDTLN